MGGGKFVEEKILTKWPADSFWKKTPFWCEAPGHIAVRFEKIFYILPKNNIEYFNKLFKILFEKLNKKISIKILLVLIFCTLSAHLNWITFGGDTGN